MVGKCLRTLRAVRLRHKLPDTAPTAPELIAQFGKLCEEGLSRSGQGQLPVQNVVRANRELFKLRRGTIERF